MAGGAFTAVDLSQLPPPDVVERLDYETILAEMLADLRERAPSFSALLESDPAYKVLEVAAYRELLLRQRVNDAARSVMLAFAQGSDLDHIAANFFGIARQVVTPADPDANPPRPAVMESDDDFRARIQISPEGLTTAGSAGSYVFHALSADPDVRDAAAVSPEPGVVEVYVLAKSGSGLAYQGLLDRVAKALNAEERRPLTDQVSVLPAEIVAYSIDAKIYVKDGPGGEVAHAAALAAVDALVSESRSIGARVNVSSIYAALQRPGVLYAELIAPAADIIAGPTAAPYCTGYTVTMEVAP